MRAFFEKKLKLLNDFCVLDGHQQQVFKYLCFFSFGYVTTNS